MITNLLQEKSALITGAGRNIGRAIALAFAEQNAHVYFTDIDEKRIKKLEDELSRYNVSYKGFISDVSNTEDNRKLIEYLKNNNISLDVLVNNVGIDRNVVGLQDIDFWEKDYKTNIFGPLDLTQLVFKNFMKQNGGNIIFISSIHQDIIRRHPIYSSSKSAIGMIIKELALEFAPYNIRVNGIAPGYTIVDENNQPLPHKDTPLHKSSIPPEYIGRAAVYLASEHFSRHTTGTVLKLDAGLSLVNHLAYEIPLN